MNRRWNKISILTRDWPWSNQIGKSVLHVDWNGKPGQPLKSAFDMLYSIVCDGKICHRKCFYPWETADLLTLKYQVGWVIPFFNVFFQDSGSWHFVLSITKHKFYSHNSFPFFVCTVLKPWTVNSLSVSSKYSFTVVTNCVSYLVLQKLIHNFHLSSTSLIYFSILKVVMFWNRSALLDLISLSVIRVLQNNQSFAKIEFRLLRRYPLICFENRPVKHIWKPRQTTL